MSGDYPKMEGRPPATTPGAASDIAAIRVTQKRDADKAGIANVVASHYNELKEGGKQFRAESRIFHMRNFNNWTKSMLIQEYAERYISKSRPDITEHREFNRRDRDSHRGGGGYGHRGDGGGGRQWNNDRREERKPRPDFSVLDIGCGKGGDLLKWGKAGVTHITCVDIAEVSVQQAKDRYSSNKHNRFSAEFFAADCTRKRIKESFRNPDKQFDLVSCQFAFHYCFESEEQAECMVRNAAESLKPGGFFIGTTPDAETILKRLNHSVKSGVCGDAAKFGNAVYSVHFEEGSTVADKLKEKRGSEAAGGSPTTIQLQDLPPFGNQYNFHLEGVVDCPEFLVDFNQLQKIAEKYGLILVGKQLFESHFKEKKKSRDGWQLLERIKALEIYPPYRPDIPLAGEDNAVDNYKVARDFIDLYEKNPQDPLLATFAEPIYLSERDKSRRPLRVGTMSKDEWEAATIYTTFAFKKMNL